MSLLSSTPKIAMYIPWNGFKLDHHMLQHKSNVE